MCAIEIDVGLYFTLLWFVRGAQLRQTELPSQTRQVQEDFVVHQLQCQSRGSSSVLSSSSSSFPLKSDSHFDSDSSSDFYTRIMTS